MCGIVGWLDWRRDVTRWPDLLDEMTGTMACRGPDGSGTWRAPRVGLGHRRLAILDPEGGAAPMAAGPGGRVAITYNGEIYNYRSLRAGLAAPGHQFRTACDTQLALPPY